jgi:hypothetical protein
VTKKLTTHSTRHKLSDLLLDSKGVAQNAVEGPRTEATAGSCDNQLYCDAHVLAGAAHTALYKVVDS